MKKFEFSRINLYSILRDLIENFWVIILAAITGFVGCASYYAYLYKPQYVSSMTVSINLSGYTTDATALSLARTVVIAESLDDVFQSGAMRDAVQKEMDKPITGTISAVQLKETNLVSVSVIDSTPQSAFETLTAIKNNYEAVTNDSFDNVIIRVVSNPKMPTSPSGNMTPRKLGVLFGLFLMTAVTGLIVIISYMRDTVKNVSDVEAELEAKLFGTVAHVKGLNSKLPNSKKRLLITNPLVGFAFSNSFKKMAVKIESLKRTKSIGSLMVTSVAENEGKTSVSVNLAISLAQNGYKVLLVDCDFKKPSIYRFFDGVDREKNSDFHSYLANGGDVAKFIKPTNEAGLYLADCLLPCENSAEKLTGSAFAQFIETMKNEFDYIIVDTPPCGVAVDAEIISGVVDASLIVVRQDYVCVTDINDHIETLNKCYLAGCIFNDVITLKKDSLSDTMAAPNGYFQSAE